MISHEPGREWRHPAMDLAWVVPLAAVIALLLQAVARFSWCGFRGCRDSISGNPTEVVLLLLLAAGLVLGAPFGFVRWTRRGWLRLVVASRSASVSSRGRARTSVSCSAAAFERRQVETHRGAPDP